MPKNKEGMIKGKMKNKEKIFGIFVIGILLLTVASIASADNISDANDCIKEKFLGL